MTRFEDVARKVRAFYEECSFPGYEEFETPFDLMDKAGRGIYAKLLNEQLPLGVRVLDAGCGTGQLVIFLSMMNRQVIGIDFSYASLKKGHDFKEKFDLANAHFFQMDLFHVGLKEESFDYVFCNGVLHHTADAYGGFKSLCSLVKKGGYIVIGLYNRYGRFLLDLRGFIFRLTDERFLWLDSFMRQKSLDISLVLFREATMRQTLIFRQSHRLLGTRIVHHGIDKNGIPVRKPHKYWGSEGSKNRETNG